MAKQKTSAFKKITNNLGQLSRSELEELQVIVGALLEATDATDDDSPPETSPTKKEDLMRLSWKQAKAGQKPKKGYVEEKIIRGYGPYLYLRFWKEGSLKSLYIGKKGDSDK